MKVILPASVPASLKVIAYERDGELVIELTDRPGNVGVIGERLDTNGTIYGRIISFTESAK